MRYMEEVIDRLGGKGSLQGAQKLIEEGLSSAGDLENLQDLLGASSMLLHAGAMDGDLLLPPLGRALEAADLLRGPDAETAVIGIGDIGRASLVALTSHRGPGAFPRAFYLDIETSRIREITPDVFHVILGATGETDVASVPQYGQYLRTVYRTAAGSNRPPPLLAENLAVSPEAKVTVHIVVGLEDPWVTVLPDLLLDLRTFLGRGSRGRTVLHLLTRPSPRVRGSFREVLQELERSSPFDEAFVVCVNEDVVAKRAADFILLSSRVPELLLHHGGGSRGGAFASYGVAPAPPSAESGGDSKEYLNRLDSAYMAATPNWVPGNVVLLELAQEQVFYIHPAGAPPPESAWRLYQNLVPLMVEDCEPTLCRVQRGLRLNDLRLS